MSAHTPGPWFTMAQHESEIEPPHIQVRACHDGESVPMKRVAICYYGESDAEREANARLLAAAPDLLDVLRSTLDDADDTGCDGCAVISLDQLAKISAVLQKATEG